MASVYPRSYGRSRNVLKWAIDFARSHSQCALEYRPLFLSGVFLHHNRSHCANSGEAGQRTSWRAHHTSPGSSPTRLVSAVLLQHHCQYETLHWLLPLWREYASDGGRVKGAGTIAALSNHRSHLCLGDHAFTCSAAGRAHEFLSGLRELLSS